MAEEDHRWMFETVRLSDFKIICKGEEIHAHKTMLALHSKYFETLFNSSFKENIDGVVSFDDVEPELMLHLLDYFYKGTTEWNTPKNDLELNVRLWILADRLEALTVMLTIEKRMLTALRFHESKPLAIDLIDMVFAHPTCSGSALGYTIGEAAWILYLDNKRPDAGAKVVSALLRHHTLSNMMIWWSGQYASSSHKHGTTVLSIKKTDIRSQLIQRYFTKTSRDPVEAKPEPETKTKALPSVDY